ncbi:MULTISPECIES: efflux RND transporter permease subunit [unclassified Methanothrix]|uniref:efflux RND transporter permease subunit n=1 Tax=unclassified Methanothrix TaxID=2620051 RepID=UPI001B4B1D06|nr:MULTISPECIES: RND family transporter [unclassified Methanothrix]MBP7067565.1 RND family transporter [Methanothrix sp.]
MISLERLGAWITRNPAIIISLAVLLTVFSVHYAQQVESQGMTTESFVSKDSILYQLYDHLYQENFGTDGNVILMEGDDVAKAEFLSASLRFSDHIKQVQHVVGVQSIADTVADAEYQSSGIRRIPSQEKIDEILAAAGPEVKALMPDRKHTRMIVSMPTTATLTESQRKELLMEINDAVNFAEFPAGYGITVTGDPSFQEAILELMNSSNGSVLALCGVLMIVALLLFFRHVRWSLLPLPVVLLGIIWTFGAMGFFGIPMSMVSFAAFPIMIGIGIDYAIQFHNRIYEELDKGLPLMKAAINTVNHVAIPVAIALIVTEAGFISLLSSTVPSINDFGKVCIIGLVMCYLSALFVNVTVLYLSEKKSPRKKKAEGHSDGSSSIGVFLAKTANICVERWKAVLAVALVLAIAGNYVDTLVPIETDTKNYIPQDLSPLIDLKHMKAIFGGTDSIQFLVQADDITDPENLRWMDDFGNYLLSSREDRTESATSIATYIKAANDGELPDDKTRIREIVASLPKAVQDAYLSGHNLAAIDVNIGDAETNLGTEGMDRLIKSYEDDLTWMTPPPGVSVRITGQPVLMTTVMDALTSGRIEMSLLGLVLIFFLLLLIYRDLIKALLPVLPMLVVIGWMGLVMYYGGLKYTPLTATLGALVLGIGSEYAILMMERFYEELDNVGNPYEAMNITANRIGSALVASGMTVTFGFAALISSPFNIISNFGVVTVMSVVLALVTTFTVFVVLAIRMEVQREVLENAKLEMKRAIALINNQRWRRINGN